MRRYHAASGGLPQPGDQPARSSTSAALLNRTRWVHMEFKLPDFSSRPSGSMPLRLMPTSTRVAVEGWTRPNCSVLQADVSALRGDLHVVAEAGDGGQERVVDRPHGLFTGILGIDESSFPWLRLSCDRG